MLSNSFSLKNLWIRPLVPLYIFMGFGIILGNIFSFNYRLSIGIFIIFFFVFIIFFKKILGIFPVIIFFLLGYVLISFSIFPFFSQNHISKYSNKDKYLIKGQVSSYVKISEKRKKIILSKLSIGKDKSQINPVTGSIILTIYGDSNKIKYNKIKYAEIRYGDKIQLKSKIKSIHNFENPGRFNYKKHMNFKNIYARAWAKTGNITILNRKESPSFFMEPFIFMENYRENFSNYIFKIIKNKNISQVLCALITGKKNSINKNLRDDFAKTGTSHILAISGLHLSIVASIFFYFFNRLLCFSNFLLIRGWTKKIAGILTLFPIFFYAFLSGFSPSTRRAFIMILIFMFSFIIEKEDDALNSLAAAGIAIFLLEPEAIFSISFQLSFVAVFFIILGFSFIRKLSFIKKRNFKTKILLFLFISLFAILGTNPIIMYYFNMLSFAGIFTNLIIIPFISFFVVPLGISAFFIFPFFINISSLLLKCSGIILGYCILFINYISQLPFVWTRTVTPDIVEILCYYIFFAGIFFVINKKKKKGLICIFSALIIFSVNGIFWIKRRFFNKNLYVTILDVGQGSSALIEMPLGKRILIDGGGFSFMSSFDTGQGIVAPFLWKKKIMTLDSVILSHPEADHMNGLIYILQNFNVLGFIKNCDKKQSRSYAELMKIIAQKNIKLNLVHNLKKIQSGEAFLEFLYPLYGCAINKNKTKQLNNNSIVLKLNFKNNSIIFTGDIMKKAEKKLVAEKKHYINSDILIAPHHGSATSNSDIFINSVSPKDVIISCGRQNRFGFPKDLVLKRYKKIECNIYRTDINGGIKIFSRNDKFFILPYIKMVH